MTEKQMDRSLKRVWYHFEQLQAALNEAHNMNLIKYTNYQEESPCQALSETRKRFKLTTEKQISDFIHETIRRRYW